MIFFIILAFILIFILSFYLALRSLSELEIPKEVIDAVKEGRKAPGFWGVIIFLKGKTVHYSSSSSSDSASEGDSSSDIFDSTSSSSRTPSRSSERIDE